MGWDGMVVARKERRLRKKRILLGLEHDVKETCKWIDLQYVLLPRCFHPWMRCRRGLGPGRKLGAIRDGSCSFR